MNVGEIFPKRKCGVRAHHISFLGTETSTWLSATCNTPSLLLEDELEWLIQQM